MRRFANNLAQQCHEFNRSGTRGILTLADDGPQPCPLCQGPTKVYKTSQRVAKNLQLGSVLLLETSYQCAADIPCRHASGERVIIRPAVTETLMPNRQLGYDVMTLVGCKRFLEYQQRNPILTLLEEQGITLSAGTESDMVRLLPSYIRMLHDDPETQSRLRNALEQEGGYWLHIDATGENGRGTTVAVYVARRRWVLDVTKISTENIDELYAILRRVVTRFGIPLAIMSDMGKGVRGAIEKLEGELALEDGKLVQLICHLHFVRDLGKDLLKSAHTALGNAATACGIRARLRSLERDLTDLLGDKEQARQTVSLWLNNVSACTREPLPTGIQGASILRSMVQWTLDYRADGHDDFPFDQRNLDFYHRCTKAIEVIETHRKTLSDRSETRRLLERFSHLLSSFCSDKEVLKSVESLRTRLVLWEELRAALRLESGAAKSRKHVQEQDSTEAVEAELQDIQTAVVTLCNRYRTLRPESSRDQQNAIDVILRHMDTYGPLLWGHVIELADGRKVVVDRTNNALENFWGDDKCGERHRSGLKVLTNMLETRSADALLVHNLSRPDYVELLCGDLEHLPAAFARLDARFREAALAQPKPADPRDKLPRTVSAYIALRPGQETQRARDRKLIRSKAFSAALEAAAQARVPPEPTAPERGHEISDESLHEAGNSTSIQPVSPIIPAPVGGTHAFCESHRPEKQLTFESFGLSYNGERAVRQSKSQPPRARTQYDRRPARQLAFSAFGH